METRPVERYAARIEHAKTLDDDTTLDIEALVRKDTRRSIERLGVTIVGEPSWTRYDGDDPANYLPSGPLAKFNPESHKGMWHYICTARGYKTA